MAAANSLGGLAQRRIAGGLRGQRDGLVQRQAILDQQLEDLDEDGRAGKLQHATQPRNPTEDPSRANALRHGRAFRRQPPQPGQRHRTTGPSGPQIRADWPRQGNRPEPLAAGEVQIPKRIGKSAGASIEAEKANRPQATRNSSTG